PQATRSPDRAAERGSFDRSDDVALPQRPSRAPVVLAAAVTSERSSLRDAGAGVRASGGRVTGPETGSAVLLQSTASVMHTLFEPHLVNDSFGDPGLYVDFRDERRALLFDLGDITALPPRKLMRLSHVFVTHTHMDHFSGFDHLLRVVLGRKESVVLYGGPDFIAQVEHKLRAYTWNVVHRYEVDLVLDVFELDPSGIGGRARFSSRSRFAREPGGAFEPAGDVLHDESTFRVRGR